MFVVNDDGSAPARLERELLGGDRKYARAEVAELSGVPYEQAASLWRALGFADVGDDETAFTDRDVDALRTVTRLVELGVIDEKTQLAMTRAMGQSLSRLADWQVSAITSALASDDELHEDGATEAARSLVPVMESLISYVWRRHLAAAAGRALASSSDELVARTLVVGFADLVGFTALTRDVDEAELALLLEQFEAVAADVIAELGGRVIKTVGDEVMFAADDPSVGADIALTLLDRVAAVDDLPDLRIGLAYGSVLTRLGDIYGEPVNLASRLTSVARPGSVLVDRELASALEGDARWRLRRTPPRPVRGYALLQGMRLRRSGTDADD